jgi:hypothetical protein
MRYYLEAGHNHLFSLVFQNKQDTIIHTITRNCAAEKHLLNALRNTAI